MILDLDDEETRALLNLSVDGIEADRYPLSPRVRVLKDILVKCGEMGGLPPELAQTLRRYKPLAPASRPPPKVYEPPSKGRYRRR